MVPDQKFHHFRIRSLVAGTVLFSVDGGLETSISANVPTKFENNPFPFIQLIARGASFGVGVGVDFFSLTSVINRT
jgi:hypothetical protein